MIIDFFKKHWLILSVVLLALVLRLWGVWYGLPGLFIGDEKSLVGGALKMIYQQNIFPVFEPSVFRILYYPTLIPWIYLIPFVPYTLFIYFTGDFNSFTELRNHFVMDPSPFFLIARIINAFFASGIVFLVYLIAKKIFNYRAGIIAALLYTVSFLPIHQGHFSKHWNFGAFFGLLALYFAFLILEDPKKRNYILAGLMTGLAFFSDYVFGLYGLIVVLVHFLLPNLSLKEKVISKRLWCFVVISLVIFSLAILSYPQEFHRMAFGEDSTAGNAKTWARFSQVSYDFFNTLLYLATFISFLAIIGYIFLLFRDRKKFFLLFIIPLISFFLYYFIFHFEPRYVLLFLPITALVAGYGLDQLFRLLKIKSNLLIGLIVLAFIFIPLKNAIVFDKILTQTDTRNLAKEWILQNIPAGSKIVINSWEFHLNREKECIIDQLYTDNMSLRSRDYVMMEVSYPNSYCVWRLDLIRQLPKNVDEYEYYLVDYFTGLRFAYLGEDLIEKGELIKVFKGSPYDPSVQIISMFVHQRLKQERLKQDNLGTSFG